MNLYEVTESEFRKGDHALIFTPIFGYESAVKRSSGWQPIQQPLVSRTPTNFYRPHPLRNALESINPPIIIKEDEKI